MENSQIVTLHEYLLFFFRDEHLLFVHSYNICLITLKNVINLFE